MFIRKKSKKATDKKSYVQHQLIESVRTASGPRQQIVLNRTKEAAIGTYVLRTNRLDLCGEEISKLHRSLVTLEKSFEDMKGDLGLRPNFHQGDIPTIAHVHVTVLAYHNACGDIKKVKRSRNSLYVGHGS